MRFKLTLTVDRGRYGDCLPINYQYEQSAVIYKLLASADERYSSWLHDNGFQLDNGKRFKLFCYSRFEFEKYRIIPKAGCINIIGDRVEWLISFLPEKSTSEFIEGLFAHQEFVLGNQDFQVAFSVRKVEALTPVTFQKEMKFLTLSPVCIREREGLRRQYLVPGSEHYNQAVLKGLLSRYKAYYHRDFQGDLSAFCLEILSQPKSVLVTIKSGTAQQTRVRGFMYHFKLTAPGELLHVAFEGGIGEECSQGFGCIGLEDSGCKG
ncbi:CRISPR-associated endoribonuclease Cas6 [Prevotella cerevisiae]|jgi:CRISPR-associated endoribonuclease Cas6|uniref:CRISPR-associated endoribonuclease n=1 Tax=Segatella cerevisiae TaxID=2053716 RepID=A0ABT1BU85_9BACT|nr:CRISPR-associated endoribonuclease Cas6 [Segatella cerevisiae]MCO6024340.1 CRISPR-associated endoribonuclease Cas6 [Segatella cerevisiae]